jgi:hypothetical protein
MFSMQLKAAENGCKTNSEDRNAPFEEVDSKLQQKLQSFSIHFSGAQYQDGKFTIGSFRLRSQSILGEPR